MITKDTLNNANEWFKFHNVPTFIYDGTMYMQAYGFEFQLSSAEVFYRAEEYLRLKENNLIKQ